MNKKYLLKEKKKINIFFKKKKNKNIEKIFFKELIFFVLENNINNCRFALFISKNKAKSNWLKNKIKRIIKNEINNILLNNSKKFNKKKYYDIVILKNSFLISKEQLKIRKDKIIKEIKLFCKIILFK